MYYLYYSFWYCFFLSLYSLDSRKIGGLRGPNEQWSGEATRSSGFAVEDTRVDVTIGDEITDDSATRRKERPIWMMESTVMNDNSEVDVGSTQNSILDKAAATATTTTTTSSNHKQGEDIMSVLLAHEKKGGTNNANANAVKAVLPQESSDSSDNEEAKDMQAIDTG